MISRSTWPLTKHRCRLPVVSVQPTDSLSPILPYDGTSTVPQIRSVSTRGNTYVLRTICRPSKICTEYVPASSTASSSFRAPSLTPVPVRFKFPTTMPNRSGVPMARTSGLSSIRVPSLTGSRKQEARRFRLPLPLFLAARIVHIVAPFSPSDTKHQEAIGQHYVTGTRYCTNTRSVSQPRQTTNNTRHPAQPNSSR